MAFFAGADVTFHLQKGSSHFFAPGSLRKEVLSRPDPSSSNFGRERLAGSKGWGGGACVSGAGGGEGWEGVDGGEC